MTGQTHSGGCACGKVTLEVGGEPRGPMQCYCRQCQRASGGEAASFVIAQADQVTITGDVREYAAPIGSDAAPPSRGFCPNCGTAIYSRLPANPEILVVKMSALDRTEWGPVQATLWTCEAPDWATFHPGAPAFEKSFGSPMIER